jgi:hypothetical protein
MFFIKYYVSSQFTHYLTLFLCNTTNSLHKSNCTVTKANPLPQFHTKLPHLSTSLLLTTYRLSCLFPCTENKSTPNVIKRIIFVTLGTFSCPSSRYFSILSKSKNLYFGQLSLNLTHCVAPQTTPNQVTLDPIRQAVLFVFRSRYTTVLRDNWPRDATSKPRFSSYLTEHNLHCYLTFPV